MKNVSRTKRLCLSTVFLVSIIFAIVTAKEERHEDISNAVNVNDDAEAVKAPRSGQWSICHHGMCGRRRSGSKRGMQRVSGMEL